MDTNNLDELANVLSRGGTNYSVFLRSYSVPVQAGDTSDKLAQASLGGDAVVEHFESIKTADVLAEVRSALAYAGDSGAGPDPGILRSERFDELLSAVLSDVERTSHQAARVERFQIADGHPAYPVFWDFAFLFVGQSEAVTFVGSSSD